MYKLFDEFMYFFCHAQAASPPIDSWIKLSDNIQLTVREMERQAPARVNKPPFPGRPLIFINACESAQLSSSFFTGFVPYFLAKGARGVIGTECDIPTVFASEWAARFFDAFLEGMPLGEALLKLRRDFFKYHKNILGLVYAAHCDSDVRIDPNILPVPRDA